jgi:hypothetical protein
MNGTEVFSTIAEEEPSLNAPQKQDSLQKRIRFQKSPHLLNSNEFQPQVAESSPPARLRFLNRDKFSSTATIFMSNSIKSADVDEIILCLSRSIEGTIKKLENKDMKIFKKIFSEEVYPLGDGKADLVNSPTEERIFDFILKIFEAQDLSPECGVMAIAYIERLMCLTGITIHASNWRRIVLGALLLSSKVWEDLAVWNVDFLSLFPNLKLHDLNRLELEYLSSLHYTVSLSASIYAKYYFQLRSLSDTTEDYFPLRPLDSKTADFLVARSMGLEEELIKIKNHTTQRSSSLNPYEKPNTKNSLSLEEFRSRFSGKTSVADF